MSSRAFTWALPDRIPGIVKIWLVTGLVMIFMQIVIGGVTRLTGSGLSITRWEIVTGAIPPLNEADWISEFSLYQQTPQYHKINKGMSLEEFKFIYFWEYFHRLWARLMFFVFIIPFPVFIWKGMLTRELRNWLVAVVLLAGLEGFFGWIMVASGLRERPWVNAYNLTLHLSMGVIIFCTLLWTTFIAFRPYPRALGVSSGNKIPGIMLGVAFFQIALGAMMSGTKAGLFYPTWPDLRGEYLPDVLLDPGHWQLNSFLEYDTNPFMPALIQFLHRNTAYILTVIVLWFSWKGYRHAGLSKEKGFWSLLLSLLALQVTLGIITLVNCTGSVPVDLGVYHQACAVLLIGVILWSFYRTSERVKSV